MMTSGLVSLNIHEPLTFEGTEVVLHPDLFSSASTSANLNSNSSVVTATGAPAATTTNAAWPGDASTAAGGAGAVNVSSSFGGVSAAASAASSSVVNAAGAAAVGGGGAGSGAPGNKDIMPLAPTSSTEDKLASIAENRPSSSTTSAAGRAVAAASAQQQQQQNNNNKILRVGDMIEIQVWDPLPASSPSSTAAARKRVGAPNRHRQQQQNNMSSSPPEAGNTAGGKSNAASVMRRRCSPPPVALPPLGGGVGNAGQPPPPPPPPPTSHPASAQSSASGSASGAQQQQQQQHDRTVQEAASNLAAAAGEEANRDGNINDGSSTVSSSSPGAGFVGGSKNNDEDRDGEDDDDDDDRTRSVHNEEGSSSQHSPGSPATNQSGRSGSVDNQQNDAPAGTNAAAASSSFPARTVVTSSGSDLPPVFPHGGRGRTNTADSVVPGAVSAAAAAAAATTTTTLPPKPPTITQRRTTTGSTTPPVAATSGSVLPPVSSLPRPRHFRDLSDMTIDTVYGSASTTTALDGSHQLTDLGAIPMAAGGGGGGPNAVGCHSDDEDDVWVTHPRNTHSERLSLIMLVTEKTLTSLKGSARTQVSLLRPIAELYNLSSFDMVTVRKIEKDEEPDALEACSADFVLVTIKDQFISRGDMHFFQKSLVGSWVYEGQRLSEGSRGIQAHAREIRHKDRHACSGVITDQTKITFRSRSARLIWLVQMSSEMWDYSSPYERGGGESRCETYFDKWIAFLHRLFVQWKELEVTHSLTVVFFSRTFLGSSPPLLNMSQGGVSSSSSVGSTAGRKDVYGRSYEDHFRIVVENATCADWDSLIVKLKEAFVKYPSEVGWNLSSGDNARRPSSAAQGNVLEAINVTLNLLQFHYLDRDLHRTGNSIVLVSGGNGVFEVTKGLASITYERMMVNGIGSDMLSLGLPPLHTAPFFLYVSDLQSVDTEGVDFGGTYYEVPHWMHLSFVSYDTDGEVVAEATTSDERRKESMCVIDIDGRPVLANGFLLPGVIRNTGTSTASPSLFSVQGSTVGSPIKRSSVHHNHQRQMIAERDFADILEACRPRNAGVLPSSLVAVLRIFEKTEEELNEQQPEPETVELGDDIPTLPEWGAMGDDPGSHSPIKHRRTVALGEEPAVDLTPLIESAPSTVRATVDEMAEKSSLSSSYTSHVSSCGLGVSYDRPFLANGASPTMTGIQVQKSPSLDIFLTDDDDMDDIVSEGSVSSTGLDLGGESSVDSGSDARRRKRGEKYMETIRKLMRECDASCAIQSSPRISAQQEPALLGHGSERSLQSQQLRPQARTGPSAGGIGAALSQYRLNADSSSSVVAGADSLTPFARPSSSTILSGMNQSRRFPDVGSRGMSPLFLPPSNLNSADIRRSSFDNRLVHPNEVARSVLWTDGRALSQRSSMYSTMSRSPPTNGSPILTSSLLATQQRRSRVESRSSVAGPENRGRSRSRSRRKKARAFNPFRQQDEDEVLAKKSHNRRRWSHVFPLGEIEFKRHAGPNWKSLTFPAILPLSIDYFPSQQEIDHTFTFSIYNVTLSEFENSPFASFSSNKDVLMEMVRQRLIQDYQLVPISHVNASNYRRETAHGLASRNQLTANLENGGGSQLIRQFLSMGHRLQVLTYDPSMDIIEVMRYDAKSTRVKSEANTFRYNYMCFCEETQKYRRAVQTFMKYPEPYNWNKVDRIVCGGEDREMREGMRFKRLMFGLVPERTGSAAKEQEYISKFQRLLEYLNKLRDKGEAESSAPLNVKIVSSVDKGSSGSVPETSSPGISSRHSMVRFYVRLRKSKRDTLEWMEVVLDHTFDTSWSYRIMFHWLLASADRVEAQVQLLQRRCTQFGLNLVQFPQISVSRSVYLGPFKAPVFFEIHEKIQVPKLDHILSDLNYVHDGVFYTDIREVLDCIEDAKQYDFGKRWSRPPEGRQFVHRSGTLFVRILSDLKGKGIVIVLGNGLYTNKDVKLKVVAHKAFLELSEAVEKLRQLPGVKAAKEGAMEKKGDSLTTEEICA